MSVLPFCYHVRAGGRGGGGAGCRRCRTLRLNGAASSRCCHVRFVHPPTPPSQLLPDGNTIKCRHFRAAQKKLNKGSVRHVRFDEVDFEMCWCPGSEHQVVFRGKWRGPASVMLQSPLIPTPGEIEYLEVWCRCFDTDGEYSSTGPDTDDTMESERTRSPELPPRRLLRKRRADGRVADGRVAR